MYNENASAHCAYNATNTSNIVCIINNQSDYQYQYQYQTPEYLPEYSMDVPLSSYMYTLFLAFGCYSFLNPASARRLMINTLLNLAKYSIVGYGLFKENVYKPYVKHVHPRLLRLLNIDDGINEIVVVKNGKVIHTFKTMEMFVKNNPIKFVKEFSDDSESESEEEQPDEDKHVNQDHGNTTEDISDKVDYDKKCQQINELIDAFKLHSLNDTPAPASEVKESEETEKAEETEETEESENTEESDKTHENEDDDDIPDDYILDPTAFDFIIRNFYYEDEKTGETYSYVFKYDIFYKSEMNEKYDVDMIKTKYFSTRKFIGLSLKTNEQKYVINLTTPNNYYVSDNCILNYSFLKWYMMKHYNVKLSRHYVVSGIDNYVEMYKINPGKKIFVHKNRFQIVDDETFVTDDEYSGSHEESHKDTETETETEAGAEPQNESESESESESDSETHDDASNTQYKNDSSSAVNNNLEDNHDICDIEILDYD
jgi:hypothetical protein